GVGVRRGRTTPGGGPSLAALRAGRPPLRELEPLADSVRREERVMLGLRLDEPLEVATVAASVDPDALARVQRLGLAELLPLEPGRAGEALTLTRRGRPVGGAVTADRLA